MILYEFGVDDNAYHFFKEEINDEENIFGKTLAFESKAQAERFMKDECDFRCFEYRVCEIPLTDDEIKDFKVIEKNLEVEK